MDFANCFPGLRVRGRGNGTGIQHNHISRIVFSGQRQPLREQFATQSRCIRIRSAAAEILNEETLHGFIWVNNTEIIAVGRR